MKTITFKSNWGRFAYEATAELEGAIPAPSVEELLKQGLANVCFRAGGSNAEKALVKLGSMTKNQKRSEAEYSPEAAEALAGAMNAQLVKFEEEENLPHITVQVTGQHEFGASVVSRKQAEKAYEDWMKEPTDSPRFAAMPLVAGFDENDEKEKIIESIHRWLSSLRSPKGK